MNEIPGVISLERSLLGTTTPLEEDELLNPRQPFEQGILPMSTLLADEIARLNALYRYEVLDTPPDPTLDDLTALAAQTCQTPIALISLVDANRQWFKSRVGLSATQTKRDIAFCHYAIQQTDVFLVKDALTDRRFANNPLVTKDPKIRFYAGAPLITAEGFILGTLCVIDYVPRDMSLRQLKALQTLSRQVVAHLELERKTVKLQQLQQQVIERELVSQQESILLHLANQIRNSLDLDKILETAVNEIHKLLQIDRCYFLWCIPNEDRFHYTISHEAKPPELPSMLGDLPDRHVEVLAETILNLGMLRIDEVATAAITTDAKAFLQGLGITSKLVVSLKTHSGQFGAIVCNYCSGSRLWTDNEVKLLQAVTDQLAIALDQAELFAQTRATAFAAQAQAQYLTEAIDKLKQTQAQLVQHEKMSSLGQLVAGVAHEINNPVNFINGNISYASDYVRDLLQLVSLYQKHYPDPVSEIQNKAEEIDLEFLADDLPKLLSSMKMGGDRIRQIVLSLRIFSRLDEAEKKPVDIHEGIDSTLLILQSRLKSSPAASSIQVIKEYGNLPLVNCYAGQLNQVFMNILSNAIDALEEVSDNPTITIHTELINSPKSDDLGDRQEHSSLPQVLIRIRDNGTGITEAVKQKVFNPFFTTKPVGKGTGLGLSISYQIVVEKHGGILKCLSEPGQGTEFLIQIPVNTLR